MSEETTATGQAGKAVETATAAGAAQVGRAPERADAAPASENAPAAEEPAAVEVPKRRQWVTLRGTSMDLRVGAGLVDGVAHDFASAVGRPRRLALALDAACPDDLAEELRRGLTDQGFDVRSFTAASGADACRFSALEGFHGELARVGVTSDDLIVAVGREESLSLAAAASAHWCGHTMLAAVPLDFSAAISAGVTPRALDVAGAPRSVVTEGCARFEVVDLEVLQRLSSAEDVLYARAQMVAAAMADSDKAFGALWDAAGLISAGEPGALVDALTEGIRSKGKVVSSTSVAIRQSADYGQTLMRALREVVGPDVPASALLADAMRFAARLAAASEQLSIDDMFTQDELLEKLGLGTVEVSVDAAELVEAVKRERFARTNRFMLALPRAIGRVRLTAIDSDVLAEHVEAWCASR